MPIYLLELSTSPCTNPHNGEVIADISGLDNRCACDDDPNHGCQCFTGGVKIGYPDVQTTSWVENGSHVLCRAESAPTGGVEKTPAEALAILISDFGWPENSYVDGDGVVRGPEKITPGEAFSTIKI